MTREQLEHAIRAACDITDDTEVYVFGSQAILGQFPDVPDALRMSAEADISPKNRLDRIEELNAIGEDSLFHQEHGFYVHGVPITDAAKLPRNWENRTVRVPARAARELAGLCLDGHDLAASKLAAYREKDRDFVRTLLLEGLLKPRTLIARLRLLPVEPAERERLVRWVDVTMRAQ